MSADGARTSARLPVRTVRFDDVGQLRRPRRVSAADHASDPLPAAEAAREAARWRHEATAAAEHSRHSAARVIDVEQMLAEAEARTFALEESLASQAQLTDGLRQELDRADRVMTAMKASISWRVTAPLRALKQRR